MRKNAMLHAVKDSLLIAILFGIGFGTLAYAEANRVEEWVLYIGWGFFALAALMMINGLAALGAATLTGGSYHAKKSELSMRVAVFHNDKHSSIFKMIKIVFFYFVGAAVYPFALLVAILNLKTLFAGDKDYDQATEMEKAINGAKNEADETVKTADKKWKLSQGLSSYYFHSKKDALAYAIVNDIEARPEKLL